MRVSVVSPVRTPNPEPIAFIFQPAELTAVLMAEATLLASARPVPADAVVPFIVIFCILGVIVRFLPAAAVLIYV